MINTLEVMISIFGKYDEYRAESSKIIEMMQMFQGYIPSAQPNQQSGFIGGPSPAIGMIKEAREGEVSPFQNRIDFYPNRINFICRPVGKIQTSEYARIFKTIMKDERSYANRLALNVNKMLFDLPDKERESFEKMVTSSISYYDKKDEWSVRLVRKEPFEINGREESTNVCTQIQTMQQLMVSGVVQAQQSNSAGMYLILFDINTLAENGTIRFRPEDVAAFVSKADDVRIGIEASLGVQ